MRIKIALAAAAALALLAVPATADGGADPELGPDVGFDAGPDGVTAGPVPVDRAAELDTLFETLRTAPDKRSAEAAANGIMRLWLESGSDTVDLLMSWTLAAMDEEDYPQALDFLDRIVGLAPDYVEGWNKRAAVYFFNDDYAPALADLERTLALEPRHFGALAGLGTILRELGETGQALVAYREALALDPYMEHVGEAIEELESETRGNGL